MGKEWAVQKPRTIKRDLCMFDGIYSKYKSAISYPQSTSEVATPISMQDFPNDGTLNLLLELDH